MILTYTSPVTCNSSSTTVIFTQIVPFTCDGTGGGDAVINQGSLRLDGLVNNDIPTNFTLEVTLNGIVQPLVDYDLTWNGTNYIVTALNIGQQALSAGSKLLQISVTRISNGASWNFTTNTNICP